MSTSQARELERDRLRQEDARARGLAQSEFVRPLVVEAGAGTGKTATLVARVLAWTLGPGWDRACRDLAGAGAPPPLDRVATTVLGGVVAITFTEAAAAEMAERVGHGLRSLAQGRVPTGFEPAAPLVEAAERARALLGTLDQLEVRTIHAWCARLLQENALEAGLHPAFQVDAEGDERQATIEEIVESAVRQGMADPPDPDLLALGLQGIGPHDLAQALDALVLASVPPQALAEDPVDPALLGALLRDAQAGLQALFQALEGFAAGPKASNLHKLRAALSEALPDLPSPPGVAPLQALAGALLDDHAGAFTKLRRGAFVEADQARISDPAALQELGSGLARDLGRIAALDLDALRRVTRVLAPLLARVSERLRCQGVLGFGDLLVQAGLLLRGQPELRRRLRLRLRQILVDEFQDTDPIQCEVVGLLALDGPASERPGLFLVGDPKQSIYGWRSADLAAYEGFVQQVEAMGGERVRLSVNFRSVPAVLDAVEAAVRPVMIEDPGRQPAFQPLLACAELLQAPGFRDEGHRPAELWAPWAWQGGGPLPRVLAEAQRKGPVREIEARAVAQDILALARAGVAWKDVAILFRTTGELPTLVDALRAAGIPYAVERDRSYFQRREVSEAVSLVSVLAAPHDQLSLVAWLRSVWVGVPDAALEPLWQAGLPALMAELQGPDPERLEALEALVRQVAQGLEGRAGLGLERIPGWSLVLVEALHRLAQLRRSLREDAADHFVAQLRAQTLVELAEAGRWQGPWRLANLDRFFRGLLDGLNEGGDLQRILARLSQGLQGTRVAEEGRPQEAAMDAVQLMTVHKAKGLGFGHVYLIGMDRSGGGGPTPLSEVHDARAWRLLGQDSLHRAAHLARAERVGQAEQVRLLYVAMTRAKQRVVLCGLFPPGPLPPAEPALAASLVELLPAWPLLPPDLSAAAAALPGDAELLLAEDQLLRFPGRALQPATGQAPAPATSVGLAPPARVARDQERLGILAVQASQRARRPWTAAVSAQAHAELAWRLGPDAPEAPASARVHPPGAAPSLSGPTPEAQALAMAVGSGVHRALELLDLSAPSVDHALRAALEALPAQLAAFAPPELLPAAILLTGDLLRGLGTSRLLARLFDGQDEVLARELPVLLPAGAEGAVGAHLGAVDLVLRRRRDGRILVVDYKTDDVRGEALEARAQAYASQAAAYVRAVGEALALDPAPLGELWFLRADRSWALP